MPRPDIPAAKRAGLPVDLERLGAEGDGWLSDEERYALKQYGVCAQGQPGVFMVRVRTGGPVPADAARGIADLAEASGKGWIHLTTRQQLELHHVPASEVPHVLERVAAVGLGTGSTCGHTLRGVMACPDAGVGLDEPFDCEPDARAVGASVLARTPRLNCELPQRMNISFGGCPTCRDHARTNEAGFVSTVADDGELGYELWLGGSLGRSLPTLATRVLPFLPRTDVLPAVHALIDVFVGHGDVERPNRGRLKFLVRELGIEAFVDLFLDAFEAARRRPWPAPEPLELLAEATHAEVLRHAPAGGWSAGVRPQRVPGSALVTVGVPLGDLDGGDLRRLADLADDVADGRLYLTREQDVTLRHVAVADVPAVRARLAAFGLGIAGERGGSDVRACTGGPVCSLAVTPAQALGHALRELPAVRRNPGLRVHVSGCPNACAQHQIGDIGFSGAQVTVGGQRVDGYQVWLGGDLAAGTVGRPVGRVSTPDAEAVTTALVGAWEALRRPGETMAATVARFGADAFAAQVDPGPAVGWESGVDVDPGDHTGAALPRAVPVAVS